jgi:Flp pilus assembly protein TadD
MSAHLTRAQLLLAQSRPVEAEQEAMLALADQPEHTGALAVLALSRSAQKKFPEALTTIETAVGLAPDNSHLHYIRGFILHRSDRQDAARSALNESLRLDPQSAETFALLAAVELSGSNWTAALTAAEQALTIDPENVEAANYRAMALVGLGRKDEATAAIDFALHREPDNALSHANQGWNYLHRNEPKKAQEYFREALRLDPSLEYARRGMLEALRARNPVYRAMLAYFLWMSRHGAQFQWGIMIGTYFFSRAIGSLLSSTNAAWWAVALAIVFYLFIYLTWTAQPLFNLLLYFDRFGRYVLSRDEKVGAWWFGGAFVLALGCLAWWPLGGGSFALLGAIIAAACSICVAATFTRKERARLVFGGVTALLALVGAGSLYLVWQDSKNAEQFLTLFFYGFLGFQLLANFVRKL